MTTLLKHAFNHANWECPDGAKQGAILGTTQGGKIATETLIVRFTSGTLLHPHVRDEIVNLMGRFSPSLQGVRFSALSSTPPPLVGYMRCWEKLHGAAPHK